MCEKKASLRLRTLPAEFAICRLKELDSLPRGEFFFLSKTDEELSLVCEREYAPGDALRCDAPWRALRVEGVLDFSLTGILAGISAALARADVGIFAVSTYNTDYILVRSENYERARKALLKEGYEIRDGLRD